MVNSVNETVNFYQKVLGFKLVMSVPQEGVFNWAMVQCGEVSLMFQERKDIIMEYPMLKDTPMGGGLTFYIKVGDINGLYDKIKKQVNIVADLHNTFYGAEEFAIEDINGFILTFSGDAIGNK